MSWSLNIGTIAGTAVRVHVTFLLFLGWIFAASWVAGGADAAWQGLAFLVLLFACVVAHEFGHIFTARAFGVSTPDVTLLPIGGVARLERIPEEPYEEFLVAIAGPLVNVAIAVALILIAGARVNAGDLYAVESPHTSMIDRLAAVNLFLAVFNMIPAFPMDGGAGAGRAPRRAHGLRARDRNRRVHRPRLRLRARLYRAVLQPATDLHRGLRLSRGLLGGPSRRHPGNVTGRADLRGDDDAIRHAGARRARGGGGADVAAHEPGRVPRGRRGRKAGRPPRPRRSHSRAQAARPRRPRP